MLDVSMAMLGALRFRILLAHAEDTEAKSGCFVLVLSSSISKEASVSDVLAVAEALLLGRLTAVQAVPR